MIKKSRSELKQIIANNICSGMSSDASNDMFTVDYTPSYHNNNNRIRFNAGYNTQLPHESIGWPPGIAEYIQFLVAKVANSIVDNIYDEEELDNMADTTLLS